MNTDSTFLDGSSLYNDYIIKNSILKGKKYLHTSCMINGW